MTMWPTRAMQQRHICHVMLNTDKVGQLACAVAAPEGVEGVAPACGSNGAWQGKQDSWRF